MKKVDKSSAAGTAVESSTNADVSSVSQPIVKPNVRRSCIHCGNDKHFETWTEFEYNDGSDEPNTSNHLVNVEFVKCLECGEVQ
jgi:hypothetical protein